MWKAIDANAWTASSTGSACRVSAVSICIVWSRFARYAYRSSVRGAPSSETRIFVPDRQAHFSSFRISVCRRNTTSDLHGVGMIALNDITLHRIFKFTDPPYTYIYPLVSCADAINIQYTHIHVYTYIYIPPATCRPDRSTNVIPTVHASIPLAYLPDAAKMWVAISRRGHIAEIRQSRACIRTGCCA